jgi:uncharacterized phage-associated protein
VATDHAPPVVVPARSSLDRAGSPKVGAPLCDAVKEPLTASEVLPAMTVSAHDVARELRRQLPGVGVVVVHKLLYYCQGWHLAWTGEPMFSEGIDAWAMGPVVADLWHAEDKGRELPTPRALDESSIATLGYVISRYGRLGAQDLIRMTHAEEPWLKASSDPWSTGTLPHSALADFFRSDDDTAATNALVNIAMTNGEFLDLLAHAQQDAENRRDDPSKIRDRLSQLQQ